MVKRLYLDIDGTVNSYSTDADGEEICKPKLASGRLQQVLEDRRFDEIVMVSGWCTMVRDAVPFHRRHQVPISELVERIRLVIADAFPDADLFAKRCVLAFENDDRAAKIDFESDWYYIDDWAVEFFTKAHGQARYLQNQHRILTCDPHGDGADVIRFLERTVTKRSCSG